MRYLFSILLIAFILLPALSLASQHGLELNYPKFGGIEINRTTNINELVAWLYYAIIGIAGLAAFLMIVSGGFQYLTSTGNPTVISEGKERIISAILGLILIFASYMILQVINPDLLILRLPSLPSP